MTPWLLAAAVAAAPAPPAEPLTPAEQARRDALARFGVGVLRARDDRPADAVRQFEAAAKTDPAAVAPLRQLVPLYADLGRDAAAVRTAEAVLRLDPADADTAHALGQLLAEAKRPADAARVLAQAADSPRLADRPAKRLGVLRDLANVSAPAGAEDALRKAAALIETQRDALIRSGAFASAADLDRDAAVVREKFGRALEFRQKYAEAEAAYRAAAALFGEPAAARLNWNLSGVAAARGDFPAALGYLQKFLALRPDAPEPYERLADYLRKAGRADAVAPTLAKLAERSPAVPAVRWVHAAEVGRADPARADARFRELAQVTTDPAFFALVVKAYREANRPADLLALIDEWYKAARVADDDGPPAAGKPAADPKAVARARALTVAVRADAEAGRQLAAAGPTDRELADDTWELLAALADRAGRPDLAERAARRGWEAWLATARRGRGGRLETAAFHRLYGLLTRRRKWDEAVDVCERSAEATGGGFGYYRAVPLAEQGNGVDALRIVDAFIATSGERFAGRVQRARVLLILGRPRDAADECREALKDAPTPADGRRARYVLADALESLKDYAGAEAELRGVLDDDPDDGLALNNLGYNLADQGRKLDEAEELVRRAIRLDRDARARAGNPEGESGVYLDSLGWVQFRRGKLAEARATLEAATRLPDSAADPVVWDHLGDVAFRQADPGRAKEAWATAVGLYENSHQGRQAGRQAEARRKLRLVP
jgi:Tfp pilus assembly protein PilF